MGTTYSPLKSIPNFRDVGKFTNDTTNSRSLKIGVLFRGARPDECSVQDRQRLLDEYGLKSFIDLRTKTEHIEQARKRDAKVKASAAVPQTNDDVAEPLKVPNITYHEINFNGSSFSRMLISKLSWMEFFRLVGLMMIGYRTDAIKILAPSMEAMGVTGLALNSLDVCTKEMRQVFEVLGSEKNWPVLIHCTQGKDRTGLIVMVLLLLLKIDSTAIEKDYLLSERELEREKPQRMKELESIGLTEQFALCPPDLAYAVQGHIEEKYGSAEGYLQRIGVPQETINRVKQTLQA